MKMAVATLRAWMRVHPVLVAVCCIPFALAVPLTLYFMGYEPEGIRNLMWGFGSPVAGVLAILAAYLANRRTQETTRQNDITQRGQDIVLRGQDNQSYVKAVEQLGSEDILMRTGGLYGLGRLAKSAKDEGERQQIIQLIASFARTRVSLEVKDESKRKRLSTRTSSDYRRQKKKNNLVDVVAAIETLAGIAQEEDRAKKLIDLSRVGLVNANLKDIDLSGFNLERSFLRRLGRVDLSGAKLSYVNLSGTSLDETDFVGADLVGANLSGTIFFDTDLCNANLIRADLSGTNLGMVQNLDQYQVDRIIYERGNPPENLPEGLKLREGERVEQKRGGKKFLILPIKKREKRTWEY